VAMPTFWAEMTQGPNKGRFRSQSTLRKTDIVGRKRPRQWEFSLFCAI